MRPSSIGRAVTGAIAAVLLLAACASTLPLTQRQTTRLKRYEAHAGAPIGQFTRYSDYQRWTALSPDTLAYWTNVNRAYLITVAEPCTNLLFANGIALTSHANVVQTHFDFVDARGFHCMIERIQPLDFHRARRAPHGSR